MKFKLLAVDTGSEPIRTELMEVDTNSSDSVHLQDSILQLLNKMGKNSHVLIGYNGRLFTCNHTATGRTPSTKYFRAEVKYHPFSDQVI